MRSPLLQAGQRFGMLRVLEVRSSRDVLVVCDCSQEKSVRAEHLRSGKTSSCGVCGRSRSDLTGKRFGRLTAVDWAEPYWQPNGKKVTTWRLRCDCGNELVVQFASIISGATKSCGCLNDEVRISTHTTHGLSRTKEYARAQSRKFKRSPKGRAASKRAKATYLSNPSNRLAARLQSDIWAVLRGTRESCAGVEEKIGYPIESLKAHLESLWEPWMNWDNWATDGWHIDHIRPVVTFDFTRPEAVRDCWALSNLRPLKAFENMSKGAKWDEAT